MVPAQLAGARPAEDEAQPDVLDEPVDLYSSASRRSYLGADGKSWRKSVVFPAWRGPQRKHVPVDDISKSVIRFIMIF